jgi:hypothetical protein
MRAVILCVAALATGCATPQNYVTFVPVPAGYLEPCVLPPVPDTNPELSEAYVQAYQCAALGNRDKERIAQWQKQLEERLK